MVNTKVDVLYEEIKKNNKLNYPYHAMELYKSGHIFDAINSASDFILNLDLENLDLWEPWYIELNKICSKYVEICISCLYFPLKYLNDIELHNLLLFLDYGEKNIKYYKKILRGRRTIARKRKQIQEHIARNIQNKKD